MPAKYDNLPVFKLCYDALFQIINWIHRMQRDFRYGIADDQRRIIMEVLLCIYRANNAKEKAPYLQKAIELMVEVKIYTRVLHDAKQISTPQFALAADLHVNIEKNLANWCRYSLAHDGEHNRNPEKTDTMVR